MSVTTQYHFEIKKGSPRAVSKQAKAYWKAKRPMGGDGEVSRYIDFLICNDMLGMDANPWRLVLGALQAHFAHWQQRSLLDVLPKKPR